MTACYQAFQEILIHTQVENNRDTVPFQESYDSSATTVDRAKVTVSVGGFIDTEQGILF